MRSSNRRSQQPYVPSSPVHNAGEGYYVFVPADAFAGAHQDYERGIYSSVSIHSRPDFSQTAAGLPLARETFRSVAEEWFQINHERWVETYRVRLRSRLDNDLLANLGSYLIADIRPLDVLAVMRKIEGRGAIESAKRILNMASSVFRYGVATGRCSRDATADIKGALRPPVPAKRRTALPASELPAFMEALTAYKGEVETKLALRFLIFTFVRTGELRFAKWSEFENLDGADPLWRIPAERMKLRRPHLVPLSPSAVAVLEKLRVKARRSVYVLPADTKLGVISENTLLFAMYRMGYRKRATVHGFRATASTVLNEAQFNRDWIEMQLAHCDSSIRGVYNFAEWLPGRREMMNWWAEYLGGRKS